MLVVKSYREKVVDNAYYFSICKKGGVGKTTFLGYLAHYHASQGKTVLVISADDQNSIFKIFGVDNFVTDHDDDFLNIY